MKRERTFIVEGFRAWLFLSGLVLALLTCTSADRNITAKDIDCSKLSYSNAMVCCLQFMSSKTGSDSKDALCRPLVDELREHLREERKKNLFLFCNQEVGEFQSCWDKINSK